MTNHDLTAAQRIAWTRYQRMRVRLSGRLNRELAAETGLSEADFEILGALSESPHESPRLGLGLLRRSLAGLRPRRMVPNEPGSLLRIRPRPLPLEALHTFEQK